MTNATKLDAVKQEKIKPDWVAVSIAYIHSTKTLAQIAAEFGLHVKGVEGRCNREKWAESRRIAAESIGVAATERIAKERAEELAKLNDAHLRISRALLSQVSANINAAQLSAMPLAPSQISKLANAADKAQKIGRLALGASTDNHGLGGPGGEGPIAFTAVPIADYLAAREQALKDF